MSTKYSGSLLKRTILDRVGLLEKAYEKSSRAEYERLDRNFVGPCRVSIVMILNDKL